MQALMLLKTYNILQCSCELLHLEGTMKPFTPPTFLNPCSAVGTVFFLIEVNRPGEFLPVTLL